MKRIASCVALVLLAAACAERPRHATIRDDPRYPMLFPEEFDRESVSFVREALDEETRRRSTAGEWGGVPVEGDLLSGLLFLSGRIARGERWWLPPPELERPKAVLPAAPPGPPADSPYAILAELTRGIDRRPGDPVGYELRADLLESLGWKARAEQDRQRARVLRGGRE